MTDRILLIEDDTRLAEMVRDYLEGAGFRAARAATGTAGIAMHARETFDAIVLDLMLPDMDGLDVCRQIRARSSTPILMLTARGDAMDRVVGLEMGADDYVGKPFDPQELVARTKAVLRRAAAMPARSETPVTPMRFDGWHIDPARRELRDPAGARVILTGAEFDLLLAFCRHPRRTLNRDQLLDLSQGRGGGPLDRGIDILVSRIRRKIESNPRDPQTIKTVRSGGYIFTPDVEAG